MREDERPWWMVPAQILAAYTIVGGLASVPLTLTIWPRELPDLSAYLVTALGVSAVLTAAFLLRARRLALGAAVVVPIVVAVGWHWREVRGNRELQGPAAAGDPAAIARILRGAEQGWLWAIGPATVTGSLAALLVTLYWIRRRERADGG